MKYLMMLFMLFILTGCNHDNDSDQKKEEGIIPAGVKSLKINGYWKSGCRYQGGATDTSMIQSIRIDNDVVTRVSITYSQSSCSGEVVSNSEFVDTIHDSNMVLVHGYDSICIVSNKGQDFVYHVDGRYLYDTTRRILFAVGYVPPAVDCHNFSDSDFDIQFDWPYVKEE